MLNGPVSRLTLLDLTAAFDTIDRNIVLHRIEHAFGIQKFALSFFLSYLTEREQTVTNPSTLRYGVHQGSFVGPILFLPYTQPLSQIIEKHSVSHSDICR